MERVQREYQINRESSNVASPQDRSDLNMSRELQFCFAVAHSEGFPPVKRSSPIHSFAIQDILGLGEKNSKLKPDSPAEHTTLVECFAPVNAPLENQSPDENEAIISG